MKSILLSIRPEWVAKILNGEKTIEIRKKFPKDYVGWVYIYCAKDKKNVLVQDYLPNDNKSIFILQYKKNLIEDYYENIVNGKVVARFWCDKVEDIDLVDRWGWEYETETLREDDLLDDSCLTREELDNYLREKMGYAIHISKLEVFEKPRELRTFCRYQEPSEYSPCWHCKRFGTGCYSCNLTKAPQNYCYIVGEKDLEK